jgi:hypothetical protein
MKKTGERPRILEEPMLLMTTTALMPVTLHFKRTHLIDNLDINLKNNELMSTADSQLLEFKIQKLLKILNNFNEMREEGVSRQEYVNDLKDLFCKLYGYNSELMDLFLDIFGHGEVTHLQHISLSFSLFISELFFNLLFF